MRRPWALVIAIPGVLALLLGVLLAVGGGGERSVCNSFVGQVNRASDPAYDSHCQWSSIDVMLGWVLIVGGLIVFVAGVLIIRSGKPRNSPPPGWMRVPFGWQPATQPFMPVPPGWPHPVAEWVPPPGWLPPPGWPPVPPGWPQPPPYRFIA